MNKQTFCLQSFMCHNKHVSLMLIHLHKYAFMSLHLFTYTFDLFGVLMNARYHTEYTDSLTACPRLLSEIVSLLLFHLHNNLLMPLIQTHVWVCNPTRWPCSNMPLTSEQCQQMSLSKDMLLKSNHNERKQAEPPNLHSPTRTADSH